MRAMIEQLVGTKVGKYHLTQLIGQGKLSVVYVAQNIRSGQSDMLTFFVLPDECTGQAHQRFMLRFEGQAEALIGLHHRHIAPVYDYGEYQQIPYLVTPLIEGESLASLLARQGRCTPEQMLGLLEQIAEGLDYAHSQGFVHGSLKPSGILLMEQDGQQVVQIAGMGLARMLELRGIGQIAHPYPHLFSIGGTYLTNPPYVAPEVVEGAPIEHPADIYALGILVFEMLSGRPPFMGNDPMSVVLQHIEDEIPTLQSIDPHLPVAFDLALQGALARDPHQRMVSAGNLVTSFERVLRLLKQASLVNHTPPKAPAVMQSSTLPPGTLWEKGDKQDISWLGMPGMTAARMPAVSPSFQGIEPAKPQDIPVRESGHSQFRLQGMPKPQVISLKASGEQPPLQQHSIPLPAQPRKQAGDHDEMLLERWSVSAQIPALNPATLPGIVKTTEGALPARQTRVLPAIQPSPPGSPMTTTGRQAVSGEVLRITLKSPAVQAQQREAVDNRRRGVLRATGCALVAGLLLAGGGVGIYYTMQKLDQVELKPVVTPVATPTNVIGNTLQENNSAREFVNPVTMRPAILIHLANGNFVAYDRTCTHEENPLTYDATKEKLVCVRHNAVFDPANNGAVVSGPARTPLPKVAIVVQSDGTIIAR